MLRTKQHTHIQVLTKDLQIMKRPPLPHITAVERACECVHMECSM